ALASNKDLDGAAAYPATPIAIKERKDRNAARQRESPSCRTWLNVNFSLPRPSLFADSADCVGGSARTDAWAGQSWIFGFNQPSHNGKQEARREPAHQHACNAFYRAQRSPY